MPNPHPLAYTGERMVPEAADRSTLWDHLFRYHFALQFINNRDVLDVACGEGYGTAALAAAGARSVTGVDIDPVTCTHAREKYGIDAKVADATQLPFADRSFDVVVSFETIEHLTNPERFIDECYRVLRPNGVLVISTPEVHEYSELPGHQNPFHCAEMTEEQFAIVIRRRFTGVKIYSQHIVMASKWSYRVVAAVRSPLNRVRGYGRGRRLSVVYSQGAETIARADPVNAILQGDRSFGRLFNPHYVRPRSPKSGERPMYLVAVARAIKE
jgi:ubiquinone/menaquinone biosynthesis C-methylase UbiE